jgi:stage IV sporulation protein FB
MFRIGRVLGHEVSVSWTALFLAVIYMSNTERSGLGATLGLITAVGVFFSILVHELGHAVMATRLGYGPCQIVLHGLGGVAMHRKAPDGESLQISLAGPGAQIILGIILWGFSEYVMTDKSIEVQYVLRQLLFVNLAWAVVNLLPIYPLDGGHVSEILLRGRLGYENGAKAAAISSVLVVVGALYYSYLHWGYTPSGVVIYLLLIIGLNNWRLYNGQSGDGLGGY